MSGDKVIVLSTHILEEVEAVCSRATVMAEGRLRFDGTPAELRRRSRFFRSIELHLEGSPEGAQGALEGLEGVASVEALSASAFRVFPQDKRALLPQVTALASERGWSTEHVFVDPGRLDDVFRVLTREGAQEERSGTTFEQMSADKQEVSR